MTLALASWMTDAGNGVALDANAGGAQRAADLWVTVRPGVRFVVEIKVSGALLRPNKPLTQDLSEKVIRRQLKKAGTDPGDQLGPQNPGILAVGGFQLASEDLNMLETAATNLLGELGSGWPHIASIAIVGWGVLLDHSDAGHRLNALLAVRRADNPFYSGDPPISDEINSRLSPVESEIREFRLPGASDHGG
jgi:hypothetical protein